MCKKNINLRSLSKFPQLEVWVTKAKNLIESFTKETGAENIDETLHNTTLFNTSISTANTSLAQISRVEFDPKKRKRSTSDELKASKKKKSSGQEAALEPVCSSVAAAKAARKPSVRKKKSTVSEQMASKLEIVSDLNKVSEWLTSNEKIPNPFNEGLASGKHVYSCGADTSESSGKNVDIQSVSLNESGGNETAAERQKPKSSKDSAKTAGSKCYSMRKDGTLRAWLLIGILQNK